MHFPHKRLHRRAGGGDGQFPSTVVHIIYQTAEQTFTGKPAGYTTLMEDQTNKGRDHLTSSAVPTAIRSDHHDNAKSQTVLVQASGRLSSSQPLTALQQASETGTSASTSTSATAAPTSTADPSSEQANSSGSGAGAKAGIAFGILAGVLLIALLIYFLFSRKRRQKRANDNEKMNPIGLSASTGGPLPPTPAMSSAKSNGRAPRVSLRPVTQFFPNLNMERRSSKGAALALTPTGSYSAQRNYDRPETSQSHHSANPFGNNAEIAPSSAHDRAAAQNPFSSPADVAAGAVAAVSGGIVRKTSVRIEEERTKPLGPFEQNVRPASPAESVVSTANSGGFPSVHRVQLDFKPTLEDEMELKAGDLVRLLHEYDDGWALCVRMDRSRQGVVPRTCLSTRPVKPRSPQSGGRQGPPVHPNGAGAARGSPRGPPNGPIPPGSRPMRSQSPGGPGPHSQSPGPLRAPPRPRSPGTMNPRSAPLQSVPGQAI